ncbi:MAG: MgtC/SapB family protein [Planctomycetota bacterium]|jgi:putative Mg2+ transporter-C (MgtC) family protein
MLLVINEIAIALKITLCALLMFVLGRERQRNKKFVGPRTLMLMGCATTLLAAIAFELDNAYILGGIMTGVGFLGGGVITKDKKQVRGLTTATLIWTAAIIGITIGLELYITGVFVTVFSLFVLGSKSLFNGNWRQKTSSKLK